ncbi:hypothetical protein J1N35_039106, partial [Gossypium stocksii]
MRDAGQRVVRHGIRALSKGQVRKEKKRKEKNPRNTPRKCSKRCGGKGGFCREL